jgi:hypothetical protein
MHREGTHAVRRASAIEANREEHVRALRLAVSDPLVVRAALEVRVLEVDAGAAMPARRERDDARAFRSHMITYGHRARCARDDLGSCAKTALFSRTSN